jgi:hypothetical protein
MAVVKWKLGNKSAFDTDSDGNPIDSVIDASKVLTFQYNPREQTIDYSNLGNQITLLNGAPRFNKLANSVAKRVISVSQSLLENAEFDLMTPFLDIDEDLVLVDDDAEVYVVRITGFSVARRRSTASRLVSWQYSMQFTEV